MGQPLTSRIDLRTQSSRALTDFLLRSNRSAALLQLKKSGKALEDAEQCIQRRPDWDKGFYRKGLALELADRYPEVTALVTAFFFTLVSLPTRGELPLQL